jgi:hypothetical protein
MAEGTHLLQIQRYEKIIKEYRERKLLHKAHCVVYHFDV